MKWNMTLIIKWKHTWFMPAFANSNVGSSNGITEDECTYVCSRLAKKLMNADLTSLAVRTFTMIQECSEYQQEIQATVNQRTITRFTKTWLLPVISMITQTFVYIIRKFRNSRSDGNGNRHFGLINENTILYIRPHCFLTSNVKSK